MHYKLNKGTILLNRSINEMSRSLRQEWLALKEIDELIKLGIKAILLFGIPDKKDDLATGAYSKKGIIQKALKEIKNKFPDSNLRVYVEIFGEMGKIYWVSEEKDLATLERGNGQLMADPGYLAILQKSVGLFIEGSGHDTLMSLLR